MSEKMDKEIKYFLNIVNNAQYDEYRFKLTCRKYIYFFGIVARKRSNKSTWSSKLMQYKNSLMHLRDRLKD